MEIKSIKDLKREVNKLRKKGLEDLVIIPKNVNINRQDIIEMCEFATHLFYGGNKFIANIFAVFLIEEIKKKPKIMAKLRRYWGDETNQELTSFCNEILVEYFNLCKKWLEEKDKIPDIFYPSLPYLLEKRLEELKQKIKEKDREWLGEQIKAKIKSHAEETGDNEIDFLDNIANTHIRETPLMFPKNKVDKIVEEYVNKFGKTFKRFFEKTETAIPKKNKEKLTGIKKEFIANIFKNTKIIENIKKGKSLYQVAKEKKLNYDNFLYLLRDCIKFPLLKTSYGYYITYNDLRFLENIYPLIERILEAKNNYSKWRTFFRKRGWKDDRISQFTKRLVKYGVVPNYLWYMPFEVFNSDEFLNKLLKKDKEIKKIFEVAEKIFKIKPDTYQELKERLKKLCYEHRKSLLIPNPNPKNNVLDITFE